MLLSRPMKEADGFVEQSVSERASERRALKVSYILLGVALLSGVPVSYTHLEVYKRQILCSKVKDLRSGAEAKASLKRALSCI